MSKIAELLKLAEQKKDTNFQTGSILVEEVNNVINDTKVGASKSNGVGVSRGNEVKVRVSKGRYKQVSVAKDSQGVRTNPKENTKIVETSPSKDFTKVSNSITRQAIPEKYFRGLSKHTYDVLYRLTRGAIIPKRTVQLTKDELVLMTGLSKDAIKLHIKYLKSCGLVQNRIVIGSHAGWEYEVFVPEEIESTEQNCVGVSKSNEVENLPLHRGENLLLLTPTNVLDNKELKSIPNTSLKTKSKDDDDARANAAMAQLTKKFDEAAKKITGRGIAPNEQEKWAALADLLILELDKAAKQTAAISSIPAFLTEVLRRQFFAARQPPSKIPENSARAFGQRNPDLIGKPDDEAFAIKPLDEAGREEAFFQLQEFAADDFLEDFKKWYTEDDWRWLMTKLKENSHVEREEVEDHATKDL